MGRQFPSANRRQQGDSDADDSDDDDDRILATVCLDSRMSLNPGFNRILELTYCTQDTQLHEDSLKAYSA